MDIYTIFFLIFCIVVIGLAGTYYWGVHLFVIDSVIVGLFILFASVVEDSVFAGFAIYLIVKLLMAAVNVAYIKISKKEIKPRTKAVKILITVNTTVNIIFPFYELYQPWSM